MKQGVRNVLLIGAAVVLAVLPLLLSGAGIITGADGGAPGFAGADGQAEAVIKLIAPGYEPWLTSLYEPPSGEIESLLFALQAAVGAGFIGYYLGSRRSRTHGPADTADARA